MSGFLVSNVDPARTGAARILSRESSSRYYASISGDRAYNPEKSLGHNAEWAIILNGVVLNRDALTEDGSSLLDWVEHRLVVGDSEYFAQLRGSFSGAHFDAARDEWIFFTNQLGDQPIYYFSSGSSFAVGSDLHEVRNIAHAAGVNTAPRESAIIALLTYGFLIPGDTMNDTVSRLKPGEYIRRRRGGDMEIGSYHRFRRPATIDITLSEAASEVDRLFRKAVASGFEHDRISQRAHVADLSGGMDARMVSWVAHDLGYRPITNITYSQSSFRGLRYTEQIARALSHHLIVSLLDDAGFLLDAEEVIRQNHASALYSGITGGRRLLEAIDWSKFGLEHTGQLGDVLIGGSYLASPRYDPRVAVGGLYSSQFAERLPIEHLTAYEDQEMYLFHVRGLSGILSTHIIRQHYTQAISPFLDLDLVQFCLSLPAEIRWSNTLYRAWVTEYHTGAGAIPNDHSGAPLNAGRVRTLANRVRTAGPRRVAALTPALSWLHSRASMNPFEFWYETNDALRHYLANTLQSNLHDSELSPSLRAAILSLHNEGNVLEKTMALSAVLGARTFG